MKRHWTTYILFSFLIVCRITLHAAPVGQDKICDQSPSGNDWKKESLKGRVKSLTLVSYKIIGLDKNDSTKVLKGERTNFSEDLHISFNPCGFYTYYVRYVSYNNNIEMDEETFFKYNSANKLIKKSQYDYDWGRETIYDYTYNQWGKVDKMKKIEYGNDRNQEKYHYNEEGILIYSDEYSDDDESHTFHNTYQHDAYGNCIEHTTFSRNDSLPFMRNVWSYDKNNNQILDAYYSCVNNDSILTLKHKNTFLYDENNNQIGVFIDSRYIDSEESYHIRLHSQYNANGDVEIRQWYDPSDTQLMEESLSVYRYDSFGNWIECLVYRGIPSVDHEDELPEYVKVRTIEYY